MFMNALKTCPLKTQPVPCNMNLRFLNDAFAVCSQMENAL